MYQYHQTEHLPVPLPKHLRFVKHNFKKLGIMSSTSYTAASIRVPQENYTGGNVIQKWVAESLYFVGLMMFLSIGPQRTTTRSRRRVCRIYDWIPLAPPSAPPTCTNTYYVRHNSNIIAQKNSHCISLIHSTDPYTAAHNAAQRLHDEYRELEQKLEQQLRSSSSSSSSSPPTKLSWRV